MDEITAAAAAGDEDTVARLTAVALLEDVDRRRGGTPLPTVEGDDVAIDAVIADLTQRIARAHAHRDVHGEADLHARLQSFLERTGRA